MIFKELCRNSLSIHLKSFNMYQVFEENILVIWNEEGGSKVFFKKIRPIKLNRIVDLTLKKNCQFEF